MRQCSIDGCERPHSGRGWCKWHYQRWVRHGDPLVALRRGGQPGNTHGFQPGHTIGHRFQPGNTIGAAHRFQPGHALRFQPGHVAHPQPAGSESPAWRGEDVSYRAVHKRLCAAFGTASDHTCTNCGGSALDWAFDEPTGYSTDLSRYTPLCRSCHLRRDHA